MERSKKKSIHELHVKSVKDLPEAIEKCWNSIEKSKLENLVRSMPKRIDAVISNKYSWTKYR